MWDKFKKRRRNASFLFLPETFIININDLEEKNKEEETMLIYNKLLRTLAYPFMQIRNRQKINDFVMSIDAERIKRFKNIYKGKRCFIVGNGPSLKYEDLDKLHNELTFASNRIQKIYDKTSWRPDFYAVYDFEFLHDELSFILNTECKKNKFINICAKTQAENLDTEDVYWINCMHQFTVDLHDVSKIKFHPEAPSYTADSWTVTYTILQLAIYMGFSEIYLLGIDNYAPGKKHFYSEKKTHKKDKTYVEGINHGYMLARKYAEMHNIKIYNASRGGQLEVFERVDFDSLF